MKTLSFYENQAINLKLGDAKTARLIRLIREYYSKGLEPNVKELSQLSRKALVREKYVLRTITQHKDNRID